MSRIRAGDEEALADLMADEWPRLVHFLTGRTGSVEQARDAAQEAFVRLWERRERWEAGSARALIYRIGINVAADLRRSNDLRRRYDAELGDSSHRFGATPAEEFDARETRRRIDAALAALPPKRGEVFALVRFHGMTYRDAGEVLGLAPQTVANHMSLALRDLRDALATPGAGALEGRTDGPKEVVDG